jgi:hypothetical protein
MGFFPYTHTQHILEEQRQQQLLHLRLAVPQFDAAYIGLQRRRHMSSFTMTLAFDIHPTQSSSFPLLFSFFFFSFFFFLK